MRWIYLSPHLDDAVLSCGGLIFEQSRQDQQVEIWTILAGTPPPGPLSKFALENHALWGLTGGPETVAMRRAEDEEAASLVGAGQVHFDLPDCIYRISPQGEYLYTETVMTSPHPADRELPGRMADALRSELSGSDVLVCPLALGGHVDHLLVRQAAEILQRPMHYYADVPYVLNYPQVLSPAVAAFKSRLYPVSETGLETWLKGVAAYRSQVSSLLKVDGNLFDAIRSYWSASGGIYLWQLHQMT
jgi:LmbE family N-acetylglucosaminyl deacetylase